MLVLSRKKNETIVVNEEITIEVLQIKGNQIRIGIVAPRDVRVRRGELTPHADCQLTWVAPDSVREISLPFSVVGAV